MKTYDVVIIGAGPAGSTLAYLLKRKNISTLLIDKANFPRKKLCAGGLTSKAFDLYENIFGKDSFTIEDTSYKMKIYFFNEFIMEMNLTEPLRFVDRLVFDNELLNNYKSVGGESLEGVTVKKFDTDADRLLLNDGSEIKYSFLVGADGANSVVRRLFDREYKPDAFCVECFPENKTDDHTVYMYLGEGGGYGWVFPHDERVSVGYGGSSRMAKKNSDGFDNFTRLTGVDCSAEEKKGAFIPTFPVNHPAYKNILLIGDAGGFVFPTSGEGLYFAAYSAARASETISAILAGDIQLENCETDFRARLSEIYRIADEIMRLTGRSGPVNTESSSRHDPKKKSTFKRRLNRNLMAFCQKRKLLRRLFIRYCRKHPDLVEYGFRQMTDGTCFNPFKILKNFKKEKKQKKKNA